MTIDVDRVRAQTPGCAHVAHFNNAGASLPPQPVLDAMIGHLHREATIGGYEAADEAADAIDAVYTSVAGLVGCRPGEVALVENATVAWDAAFYAIPFAPGDRIVTGRAEYVSNAIAMLQMQQRHGLVIEVIDDDEHGQISLEHLRASLDTDVKVVALTHVPTNGGLVNPAAEVGRLAHQVGALFLLDACQSAGQIPLDVEALKCDMLSATGRKFLRGPRGTGFLYVRDNVVERLRPHVLDLRSATWTSPATYSISPGARRFETWEYNYALTLGLGAAIDIALTLGIEAIEARNTSLAERLRAGLSAIDRVTVRDKGERRSAIVTFTVDGVDSEDVSAALRTEQINTWALSAPSAQFDMPHRGLTHVVRASLHYFNTEEEIDRLLAGVARLAA